MFVIIVSIFAIAAFFISYVKAYKTEVSNKVVGETKNFNVHSDEVNDITDESDQYQLKIENGYIVVYKYPENTFYHNTGILSTSLDDEHIKKIKNNDAILRIDELFDFLESNTT